MENPRNLEVSPSWKTCTIRGPSTTVMPLGTKLVNAHDDLEMLSYPSDGAQHEIVLFLNLLFYDIDELEPINDDLKRLQLKHSEISISFDETTRIGSIMRLFQEPEKLRIRIKRKLQQLITF